MTPSDRPPARPPALPPLTLPAGIGARRIDNGNGLSMYVLEAGPPDGPALLLLHGFPEMAWSWRRVMPALAAAGYRVIAPDQRGFGRTTGWDPRYDGDLASFRVLNLVRDALGLLAACGLRSVTAVIGHDAGAIVAGWAAMIRPDVFRSAVIMSAPFGGPAELPLGGAGADAATATASAGTSAGASAGERLSGLARGDIHDALAALPRPRKHYQRYYATREAEADMLHAPQGLHRFLRGYFHMKSADWPDNHPRPLAGWTAEALAELPTYYVMDRGQTMAETVAPHEPDAAAVAACSWLTDDDLAEYTRAYAHTGFQGGLQWYRGYLDPQAQALAQLYAGRSIEVPIRFIAGTRDWGIYQKPGEFERMQTRGCRRFSGVDLIPGAGHWVQQEQPQAVLDAVLRFLRGDGGAGQ